METQLPPRLLNGTRAFPAHQHERLINRCVNFVPFVLSPKFTARGRGLGILQASLCCSDLHDRNNMNKYCIGKYVSTHGSTIVLVIGLSYVDPAKRRSTASKSELVNCT